MPNPSSSVGVPVPDETPDCVTSTPHAGTLPPEKSGGPHTEADLERLRMALAEVAPGAEVRLDGGRLQALVGPGTLRKAAAVARVIGRCDACWDRSQGFGPTLDCYQPSLPPYVDDCGRDRSVA